MKVNYVTKMYLINEINFQLGRGVLCSFCVLFVCIVINFFDGVCVVCLFVLVELLKGLE